MRLRHGRWLVCALLFSCDDSPNYIDTPWHLDAVVYLGQPISAAQVKLYSSDPEGHVQKLLAEAQSDDEGRWRSREISSWWLSWAA